MADMIAMTFGRDCEVVLHDLENPQHSVVYVANNTVTGRKVGESFSQLVTDVILSDGLKEGFVANYYFKTDDGKTVRSSTMLLYDDQNKLAGAMCINIDTTRITKAISVLNEFLPAEKKDQILSEGYEDKDESSMDDPDVRQMVKSLIDNIMGEDRSEHMTREDRLEKLRFMDEKGIFLMKGAVDLVAGELGVNRVTVYGYLNEIRGGAPEE